MQTARTQEQLRSIGAEEFRDRYDADRFTAAVLSNRFRYIVRHMCSNLLHNAFSPILRDWYDFAATISGPPSLNYPMPAVSNSLLLFTGTMGDAVRNTVEEYGAEELGPGDVLIVNDPYRVGTHVNDICFIRPVFHRERIVSFVVMRAHQLDMGGLVPAGFSGAKRNVFENGLVIPPTLLYKADRPIKSTFNLIFDNSRFPGILLPDLKSLYQCLLVGERLLLESIERYGVEAYLGSMRYACDVSAEALATAIRTKIPDGVHEAEEIIDADGLDDTLSYRVKVRLTKFGDSIEADFSGTSKQARTSINCGPLDVKSAVGVALKMLLDQESAFTSGTYRHIDIVLPPGSILSATPPDGAIFLFWEASNPVFAAVCRALANAIGPHAVAGDFGSMMTHNASGHRPDGSPWVTVGQCGGEHGPWGATRSADGDSYQVSPMTNNIDPATETAEMDAPVVLLRREYMIDSAGAGTNRGGAAVLKDTLWLEPADHLSLPLHTKSSPGFGVGGGHSGQLQAVWLFPNGNQDASGRNQLLPSTAATYEHATPVCGLFEAGSNQAVPDGRYHYFGSRPRWQTLPGAMFRYQTAGGGGWGVPFERDAERVCRDVRDGYVSIEGAMRDYGVTIVGDPVNDPEGLRIDFEATRAARAQHGHAESGASREKRHAIRR
jgi:N-methylhydantoinase B